MAEPVLVGRAPPRIGAFAVRGAGRSSTTVGGAGADGHPAPVLVTRLSAGPIGPAHRIAYGGARRGTAIGGYPERMTTPVVHLARPHRPVLVAGSLHELTGPEHGLVELPLRLWWNPHRTFDLDRPDALLWMYENVLREAVRVDELRTYLHGPTLVRVWPQLNLPRGVRAAWETRHRVLAR